MYIIVLDTNLILYSLKYKVDIFNELKRICNFKYEIKILDKTLDELKNKPNGTLALRFIKEKNIKLINSENGYVDELLLKLPRTYIIATNDKALKTQVKLQNKALITLRQKKYLILENVL